jgi:hypothetical protein
MPKSVLLLLVTVCLALPGATAAHAQGKSDERGNANAGENSGGGNNNSDNGNGNGPRSDETGQPGAPPGQSKGDERAALDAKREGRAVPLEDILAGIAPETAGNVIDAELVTVDGFLLYALKVLSPAGVVSTHYFYAQSGRPVALR